MLQMQNCSKDILYQREKTHSDLLMLINATVSHELRNPLNSLIAQNIEKTALYKQMSEEIEKSKIKNLKKQNLKAIMVQLQRGNLIQSSSANLMEFLI
jgi:signal transduction histidine kinase